MQRPTLQKDAAVASSQPYTTREYWSFAILPSLPVIQLVHLVETEASALHLRGMRTMYDSFMHRQNGGSVAINYCAAEMLQIL